MKASYNWLRELTGIEATPADAADALTRLGLEVEGIERFGVGLDHVVVAEVRASERVPEKDKLQLVTVFDGEVERQVICGAPNVPARGGRVLLAKPGAVLPGGVAIEERAVGGVTSSGMLCSGRELAIGEGEAGILVLRPGDSGRPGQAAVEALQLEDHVFDISLTPNRPDCLGHIGLARELALAFDQRFRMPSPGFPSRIVSGVERTDGPDELALVDEDRAQPVDTLTLVGSRAAAPGLMPIAIEDPERCPRYAGCVVQGVRVGPSPFWLRYRLHVLGVRAIDCVVDVTNLVLYELGHPIHAFDVAKLRGPEILVRRARDGEQMRTLDGVTRTLSDDDLLICDAGGPVAVAGVMGGADSEIDAETRDVLVEVAYFDPRSVRRTSRRLGLHTDSSHRFERGVDVGGVPWALRRAVALLCSLANGAAAPVARDVYPAKVPPRQVQLDPGHTSRLIGMPITESACRAALEGIGCAISPGEQAGWRVICPSWRPDLARPEDLIEEIARVVGYDAIPTELPRVAPTGRGLAAKLRLARRLRDAASALGLLEAVNFAFVSRSELARSRVPTDAVELANPLSDERSVMRTSLLPGLLADIARAHRHQAHSVSLFELARVYVPAGEGERLGAEPTRLGVALSGPRVEHVGASGRFDFYDGKGVLASILESTLGVALEAEADPSLDAAAPFLHPRRRATLRVAGRPVGVLGEVHPDVSDAYGLEARAVYGELDVDALVELATATGPAQARSLPRFPATARDVALVVDEDQQVGVVSRALEDAGGALVEAVELFDVYRGASIGEGKKSLAFRVVYRDPETTLTDKRVDKAHRDLVRSARERLGATVRE